MKRTIQIDHIINTIDDLKEQTHEKHFILQRYYDARTEKWRESDKGIAMKKDIDAHATAFYHLHEAYVAYIDNID